MMAEQGVMTEQGMREQGDDDGGGGGGGGGLCSCVNLQVHSTFLHALRISR